MRVLWISCLLIGSITCGPVGKGYTSNSADTSFMRQPSSSGYRFSGPGVSSDPGSSSPLPSLPNPGSGKAAAPSAPYNTYFSAGSYSGSPNVYSSPTNMGEASYGGYANFRDDNRPTGGHHGAYYGGYHSGGNDGGYGGLSDSYGGDSSHGYVVAPRDDHLSSGSATSYGAGNENPEPVFSDVSDLEPVYSFSSRSSYQRGRAVFAQSRYTPGEAAAPQPMLESRPSSVKAPTKGGF